jgi:hypothetical protein
MVLSSVPSVVLPSVVWLPEASAEPPLVPVSAHWQGTTSVAVVTAATIELPAFTASPS